MLALGVRLIAVLMGGLGMLLRGSGMFLPFRVIALAVVFRGGSMRLGSVLVMLGSLVVLVSCHGWLLVCLLPAATKAALCKSFLSWPTDEQKYI